MIRSSLFLMIIFNDTKHYKYLQALLHKLQTHLQTSKLLKTHVHIFAQTQRLLKKPSSLRLA
jgi:hypothetical protein